MTLLPYRGLGGIPILVFVFSGVVQWFTTIDIRTERGIGYITLANAAITCLVAILIFILSARGVKAESKSEWRRSIIASMNMHSLFFIPIYYWPIILSVFGYYKITNS